MFGEAVKVDLRNVVAAVIPRYPLLHDDSPREPSEEEKTEQKRREKVSYTTRMKPRHYYSNKIHHFYSLKFHK